MPQQQQPQPQQQMGSDGAAAELYGLSVGMGMAGGRMSRPDHATGPPMLWGAPPDDMRMQALQSGFGAGPLPPGFGQAGAPPPGLGAGFFNGPGGLMPVAPPQGLPPGLIAGLPPGMLPPGFLPPQGPARMPTAPASASWGWSPRGPPAY